ncbi:lytic polysaccharide monooxygenase [Actinoallomurus purpureus]|uniref:lytic polysaccharide monooxygenase n=1 Tax=Actinoallomurus purpureus TaxID=478114 RepID=UPI0020937793|nr:lytic polysaccharide monooxygenase [Actinoallomurus purpureus]MCO6011142.1 lytic polysaccharide monooxygenase [Actinoallomurus purpureus]
MNGPGRGGGDHAPASAARPCSGLVAQASSPPEAHRHGADHILVYVTRQGYNALTQPLRWSDLELVA